MNFIQLITKYGRYLQYLPLLVNLVTFIRTAESRWREAGSGSARATWVQEQFAQLVTLAEMTSLISSKFANALRDGSGAIITVIVQGWNDAQAAVAALPPLGEPTMEGESPVAPSFTYEKVLSEEPDRALLKSGDRIFQQGENPKWLVRQGGVGIGGLPPAPWRLIETVP